MAGDGSGFRGHAFHHIAVAAQCVHVIIEGGKFRSIVSLPEKPRRHCHSHAVAAALSQGAGSRFQSRRMAVFRMTGTTTADLTKPADVFERNRRLAVLVLDSCEMKDRIEQHRCMTCRKHKPVAIRPNRVIRIESQDALPQRVNDRRKRHRCARMARIRGLDRVHRQSANRVDGQTVYGIVLRSVHDRFDPVLHRRLG